MANYGYTFNSGEIVTPTKINNARTVSNIVDADISATAAIAGTKVAPSFGAQAVTTTGLVTTGSLSVTGNTTLGNAATDTVSVPATVLPGVRIEGSSSSDALRVTQTGSGNSLVVEDSANPDATPFVVRSDGSLVHGSTTVGSNWYSSSVAPKAHIVGTGNGAGFNCIGANTFGAIQLARTNGATADDRGLVASGDIIGMIRFAADDSVSASMMPAAQISASVDGTPGNTDMPGRLVFQTTADGTGTLVERMRITNAGDVGIGTGAPASKLHVNGTVTATEFVGNLTGTADNVANLAITDAKISATAAIAHSKLATIASGRVLLGNASGVPTATAVTGDVTISNTGITAIGAGVVVDADINANANIAHSKLADMTAGQILIGNSVNTPTSTAVSGDVTISSSGVTSIAASAISSAKIASSSVTQAKLATGVAGTGPAFRAYTSTTTTVSASTWTKVTLASEDFDTLSDFASSRFTPSVAGYYQINGSIRMNSAQSCFCKLMKNGTTDIAYGNHTASKGFISTVSDIVYMNGTTDYIELFAYHSEAGSVIIGDFLPKQCVYMSGFLARAA